MKGKHLVIGIILFVIIVVGLIYFMMMDTINDLKDEQEMKKAVSLLDIEAHPHVTNQIIELQE